MAKLSWTGERYLPEVGGEIELEHYHRYLLSKKFTVGKEVLDIACGEGYGSSQLAEVAASVIGVDISEEAIKHARASYSRKNLDFLKGSCSEIPIPDESIDVIVSFETIEHHNEHVEMMHEFKRVLRKEGVLIISSPDKKEYSDVPQYKNEFHVKELYTEEFKSLLEDNFSNLMMLGQRIKFGSLIAPYKSDSLTKFIPFDKESNDSEIFIPLYMIAIASDCEITPSISSFYASPFQYSEYARSLLANMTQLERENAKTLDKMAIGKNNEKKVNIKLKQLEQIRNSELEQLTIKNKEFEAEQGLAEKASQEVRKLSLEIERLNKEISDSRNYIDSLLSSLSWRLTAPFRRVRFVTGRLLRGEYFLASRMMRLIYHGIPISTSKKILAKEWCYTHSPILFRHTRSYKVWSKRIEKLERKLDFPKSLAPRVSIVIPVFGEIESTKNCLISIKNITDNCDYEIVVIDDCSLDDTEHVLKSVSGVRVLKNDKNLGFIRSCNRGANEARGEYLLFLNNDTEVHDGWLDELISPFDKIPLVGLVGSKLIYPDGSLQEAGGIIWADATGWNYGRGDDPSKPEYNYLREVDYCSGASIMVPKKVFNKLGKFDERYLPAYYEDTDLAFSVQQAGLKVLYQPASRVIHFEGLTSGNDLNTGIKAYQVRNQVKFLEKWKKRLAAHGVPGENVFAEKDRHALGRILIIDSITPTPDQDSGSQDVVYFFKIFIDLGYKVTFVPDDLVHADGYTQTLQNLGVECLYSPYVNSIEEYLQEYGREFDVVFLYRAWTAHKHFKSVKRHCPGSRTVFDTVDLHYLREEREAAITGSEKLASQAKRTKEIEFKLMREADATIILSEAETQMLKNIDSSLRLKYIPYVRETPGCKNQYSNRRDILFIGGFEHTPNVDAVEYFVKEIWPAVRKKLSNTSFYIIGSKIPDRVRELEEYEGVVSVGFVEDLSDFFDKIRLTVVPLRFGAGIKGKIATSAGYGVPSVATSIAVEGMGMVNGKHILVADDAESFAEKVVQLYTDETLWNRLSRESLELVKELYSYDAGKNRLLSLLKSLSGPHQADLKTTRINCVEDFKKHQESLDAELLERTAYEDSLLENDEQPFQIDAECRVCGMPRKFNVDYNFSGIRDKLGVLQPNWRETLICEGCGLQNRVRAATDYFVNTLSPSASSRIYITEQLTPLYQWLKRMFPAVVGSEYLDDSSESELDDTSSEIRNEDFTALSFQNRSLDFILSFEVLEHIPSYRKALSECARCLADGGTLVLSAPFLAGEYKTLVRARLSDANEIEHLLPPEYHGNPTRPSEGSLCYYHFGWELLDALKEEGFKEAYVESIYSRSYAYLGEEQILIVAKK